MNLTVDALKAIYEALGGSASDVKNVTLIPDMLEKIADVAASTIELPSLNKTTDNGKVLTASNGKWTKAALPGFTMIDVTISDDSVTFPTGYTQAAIKALLDAGVDVKVKDVASRVYEVSYNKNNAVDFVNTDVRASSVIFNHINLLSSGDLTGTFNSVTVSADE